METAKPHQLLRPCSEQRVGPDGLQIVPSCEVFSQDETKPRLLQAASVLERRILRGRPQGHPGGTAGKGDASLQPFPRGGGAYSLWSSGKQKRWREDGAGQTSSRHFAFCPGKHSRSQKLLPTWEKMSGQGAVAQGSPPGTAHLQQDIGPVDAILAGDQGVLLLKWRQKWQGLQRSLLGLNHTLSTPYPLLHNIPELQTFGIVGQLPHNLGATLPQGQQITGPQQPSAGNGQTAKQQ